MDRAEKGSAGERAAAACYAQRGCTLVDQNFRTRFGEIDLVLQKNKLYIFAEVKTRGSGMLDRPAAAVNRGKQRRVMLAAQQWLAARGLSEPFMRFDVVEVFWRDGGEPGVNIIENAFGG